MSEVDALLRRLFPICRSLTGPGNRETLEVLSELVPLRVQEIPCGTVTYDWEVPKEWSVREAWIKDSRGRTVVNFADHNLHLVGYSVPVHAHLTLKALRPRLHSLPEHPDWIPYRTSYYSPEWGFCLSDRKLRSLDPNETYEVRIDSTLDGSGSMTIADAVKEGVSGKEFLISTYCCHPSLANDNLSGLLLAVLLFRWISQQKTFHSYRLIVAPETIGVIAYLASHERMMKQVHGGYVVTTVAGNGPLGYKESFRRNHEVDQAARVALAGSGHIAYPFEPNGSDERQYSSPGFRIPTGSITKDKYYEYPEYHTSADNLEFISAESLATTLEVYKSTIENLEMNRTFVRTDPHGEYRLGKYGLYPSVGGEYAQPAALPEGHLAHSYRLGPDGDSLRGVYLNALEWMMHCADGRTSLLEVSRVSTLPMRVLFETATRMQELGLLQVSEIAS